MDLRRILVLLLGPLALVGTSYWLSMGDVEPDLSAATYVRSSQPNLSDKAGSAQSLSSACEEVAMDLALQLDGACNVIVRSPFVLAGDLTQAELDRQYRETIVPTAAILSTYYFDRAPNEPVTIIMFVDEKRYRRYAGERDGQHQSGYYGYYVKSRRRAVLNISTGTGTLAHELTHALADFDFPAIPSWFDEGLASLYEECEISDDGLTMRGLPNWRINYLLLALEWDKLRTVEALTADETFPGDQQAVNYAHARFLCLYLQERQLLSHFYRKFRERVSDDPTGLQTLCEILRADSPQEVDRDFRVWVAAYGEQHGTW